MRNIEKDPEPESLANHRRQEHSYYDNYREKDDVRSSLVSEQRGICCYCMQKIVASSEGMRIEHWQPKSKYPNRELDYSNLLGACCGGEGNHPDGDHCDRKKGNLELRCCPADPSVDVECMVRFLGDGTIKSDDPAWDDEINRVLNLNEDLLKKNRRNVLEAFLQSITESKPTNESLLEDLREWRGDDGGELAPFCQVVVYHIKKRLNRNGENF